MMKHYAFGILLLSAGLAFACGSDDGDDGGTGATGGSGGAPASTVKLGATFTDFLTKSPVVGLEICTLLPEGRTPNCASTNEDGKIVAEGFPMNFEVLFTAKKEGVYPLLISAVSTEEDITDAGIYTVTTAEVDFLLSNAGLTQEAGKGAVTFRAGAETEGLADVTVTVSPSGTPVYMDGIKLDPDATKTTSAGVGVILNLEPETEVTITFEYTGSPARTCTTHMGWTGSASNVRRVPIKADILSYLPVECL